MPSLITTIEDNSPLIAYSGGWNAGSSTDSSASLYSGGSFTYTNTTGDSATFTFNGTGVQIFGSKRRNHGLFQVKLDGTDYSPVSGNSSGPAEFQQEIFSVSDLVLGLHQVILTNRDNAFLDIDFITWQTRMGTDNDELHVDTYEDSDPSFTYLPSESSWTKTPTNLGTYMGGSGHATMSPGAVLSYNFKGEVWIWNGVSLVGPVGPSGSPYTVQIDSGPIMNYTSNKQYYMPQTTLYHADGLEFGQHVLKLTYEPTAPGQVFAIDYANVYSATPLPQLTSQGASVSNSMGAGPIAGAVIPAVVLLLILSCWLFRRYRGRLRLRKKFPQNQMDVEAYRKLDSRSGTLTGSTAGLSALSDMKAVQTPFVATSDQIPSSPPDSSTRPLSPPLRIYSPPPPPSPIHLASWKEKRDTRVQQLPLDASESMDSDDFSDVPQTTSRSRSDSIASNIRRVRLDLPDEPEPVFSRPDLISYPEIGPEAPTTRSRSDSTTSRNSSSPRASPFPLPSFRPVEIPVPSLLSAVNQKIIEEPYYGRSSPMYPNHPHMEKHRADKFYYI